MQSPYVESLRKIGDTVTPDYLLLPPDTPPSLEFLNPEFPPPPPYRPLRL